MQFVFQNFAQGGQMPYSKCMGGGGQNQPLTPSPCVKSCLPYKVSKDVLAVVFNISHSLGQLQNELWESTTTRAYKTHG